MSVLESVAESAPESVLESVLETVLQSGFFSQVEVVGVGRHGTSGQRHVDGIPEGVRVEPHQERHGRVVRSWVTVTAETDVVLEHVSSFAMTGVAAALGAAQDWEHRISLWSARNPWSGEHRWSGSTLGDLGLYDVGMTRFGQTGTKNRVALGSAGSWSSAELLPMGWLTGLGGTLAWQIEHNGSWHGEVGDRHGELYLALSGPSHREHGWSVRLAPGESFTTVPVGPAGAEAQWEAGSVRARLAEVDTACPLRLTPTLDTGDALDPLDSLDPEGPTWRED